jgi:hypothetical protein
VPAVNIRPAASAGLASPPFPPAPTSSQAAPAPTLLPQPPQHERIVEAASTPGLPVETAPEVPPSDSPAVKSSSPAVKSSFVSRDRAGSSFDVATSSCSLGAEAATDPVLTASGTVVPVVVPRGQRRQLSKSTSISAVAAAAPLPSQQQQQQQPATTAVAAAVAGSANAAPYTSLAARFGRTTPVPVLTAAGAGPAASI